MRNDAFNILFSPKVWAGNEDCEDVTWQECKLVEQTVDFTLPKVECEDSGNAIPYMRFVDTNKTQMINKMVCEVSNKLLGMSRLYLMKINLLRSVSFQVKSSQSCKPAVSTKCASIEYQECSEAPVESCEERDVSEPQQVCYFKLYQSC